MIIKQANISDIDLIVPLADEFVSANTSLTFRPDYRDAFREHVRQVISDSEAVAFVAKNEQEVVGVIIGQIKENGPTVLPERIGYIGITAVSSKMRRKGIGRKLWKKMNDWFLSKGIEEVQLYTDINNNGARDFWKYCGFDVILERRRKQIGSLRKDS